MRPNGQLGHDERWALRATRHHAPARRYIAFYEIATEYRHEFKKSF